MLTGKNFARDVRAFIYYTMAQENQDRWLLSRQI